MAPRTSSVRAGLCLQGLRQSLGHKPRLPSALQVTAVSTAGVGTTQRFLSASSSVFAQGNSGNGNSDHPEEGNDKIVTSSGTTRAGSAQRGLAPGGKTPTAAVDRTRSKLPTAKAKAQASKALRQQLQAASGPGNGVRTGPDAPITKPGSVLRGGAPGPSGTGQLLAESDDPHGQAQGTYQHQKSVSASGRPLVAGGHGRPGPHQLKEVVAWATADSYDFDALIHSGNLPRGWTLLEDDEAIYIPSWPPHAHSAGSSQDAQAPNTLVQAPPGTGEVFIFQSGSYVTWGLSEEQSQRFLRSVIRKRPSVEVVGLKSRSRDSKVEIEKDRYFHIGDEAMEWVWRENEWVWSSLVRKSLKADEQFYHRPTRIVGDVIVLGHAPHLSDPQAEGNGLPAEAIDAGESTKLSPGIADADATRAAVADEWSPLLARLAFSQGLSRSARLSAQETALDNFLFSLNSIPEQLEKAGKVPLPRKEVIRRMGTLLSLRQRANLSKDNFLDDPEGHWDNGSMECESE